MNDMSIRRRDRVQYCVRTGDEVPVTDGGQRDKGKVHALVERPLFEVGNDTGRNQYENDYTGHQVRDYVHDEAQLRSHHPLRFVAVVSSKNLN